MKKKQGPSSDDNELNRIIAEVKTRINGDAAFETELLFPTGQYLLVPAVILPGYLAMENFGDNFLSIVVACGIIASAVIPSLFDGTKVYDQKLGEGISPSAIKTINQIRKTLTGEAEHVLDVQDVGLAHLAELSRREGLTVDFVVKSDSLVLRWNTIEKQDEKWDGALTTVAELYNLEKPAGTDNA